MTDNYHNADLLGHAGHSLVLPVGKDSKALRLTGLLASVVRHVYVLPQRRAVSDFCTPFGRSVPRYTGRMV